MTKNIDFYFDLSSPYGYLACSRGDEIEQQTGYQLDWKPYLMGAVFKETGRQPQVNYPLISNYAYNDIQRSARKYGVEFNLPDPFPVITAAACRACHWAESLGTEPARRLVMALYKAYMIDNINISKPEGVLTAVENCGLDRAEAQAATSSPEMKELARQRVNHAIENGIFGSPFFVVDGEAFWGNDRVDDLILWCQKGGW